MEIRRSRCADLGDKASSSGNSYMYPPRDPQRPVVDESAVGPDGKGYDREAKEPTPGG